MIKLRKCSIFFLIVSLYAAHDVCPKIYKLYNGFHNIFHEVNVLFGTTYFLPNIRSFRIRFVTVQDC